MFPLLSHFVLILAYWTMKKFKVWEMYFFFYVATIMSFIKNISQMTKQNIYFCKTQLGRHNYLEAVTAARNCTKLHRLHPPCCSISMGRNEAGFPKDLCTKAVGWATLICAEGQAEPPCPSACFSLPPTLHFPKVSAFLKPHVFCQICLQCYLHSSSLKTVEREEGKTDMKVERKFPCMSLLSKGNHWR